MNKYLVDLNFDNVSQVKNAIDPVDPQDYVTKSYGDANYGGGGIPQFSTDPVSPIAEQTWVRSTQLATGGSPIGLLLSLTHAVNTYAYELRYRTQQGTTVGVPLS